MAANRSFIFFREAPVDDPGLGPIAAAKVPLTAGRSLAVDRLLHSFHVPVWVETLLPERQRRSAPADRPGHRLGDRRAGARRHLLRVGRRGRCARRRHARGRPLRRARSRATARMSRRRRGLSDEERQLWDNVARSAASRSRRRRRRPRPPPQPVEAGGAEAGKAAAARQAPPSAKPAVKPRRRRRRPPSTGAHARGSRAASLDVDARARPARTDPEPRPPAPAAVPRGGTGGRRPPGPGDHRQGQAGRRGAAWRGARRPQARRARLAANAEFRHLVAGFDEAGRRHGGGGALYVRLSARSDRAP